jgi:hypothetical protein
MTDLTPEQDREVLLDRPDGAQRVVDQGSTTSDPQYPPTALLLAANSSSEAERRLSQLLGMTHSTSPVRLDRVFLLPGAISIATGHGTGE